MVAFNYSFGFASKNLVMFCDVGAFVNKPHENL